MNSLLETANEMEFHLMNDEAPSQHFTIMLNEGAFDNYPFTMLSDLVKVEQSPKFHPEGNVWNHTMLVVDNAAKRKAQSKSPEVFMYAALLHDIGKAPATKMRNGKITAYDHDKLGEKMAVKFLEALDKDTDFIKQVSAMVRWHMQILYVMKNFSHVSLDEMMSQVSFDEIALLGLCDRLGRGNMTKEKIEEEEKAIEIFVDKCKEYRHNIV